MKDIVIILRACDAVEAVNNNGVRPLGHNKKDIVKNCVTTLFESINFAECEGFTYKLLIIKDNLSKETEERLKARLIRFGINAEWRESNGHGNINSFKTCYEYALGLEDGQFFLFIEDDYVCDKNSISELIKFYRMFDKSSNRFFINPSSDLGDYKIVTETNGKYDKTVVLPGAKSGIGIWWRQVYHSTSTFATTAKTLRWYKYVFDVVVSEKRLHQYVRNRIYKECPCFAPLYPLMEHFQKPKTLYWFDEKNDGQDFVYKSDKIFYRKDKQTVDITPWNR